MARPRGKAVTKNGQHIKVNLDPESLSRVAYGVEYLDKVLEVPANNGTVLRRALEVYIDHLENLEQEEDRDEVMHMAERLFCFEANEGRDSTINTPIEFGEDGRFPKFSSMIPPKWPKPTEAVKELAEVVRTEIAKGTVN